jgi:hypothetical protein
VDVGGSIGVTVHELEEFASGAVEGDLCGRGWSEVKSDVGEERGARKHTGYGVGRRQ